MKQLLLVGINAKFIHSNLAVRYIKKYIEEKKTSISVQIKEFSINQNQDYILDAILQDQPSAVAFSCYLWNIDFVRNISRAIKKVNPDMTIVYGGPEVMYTPADELKDNHGVDFIVIGEGEETMNQLGEHLLLGESLPDKGIAYRNDQEEAVILPKQTPLDMKDIPFVYDEALMGLENRILYYETSRGCPFKCQYCLSSIEKGVRFRPLSMVYEELQFFLDKEVRQVKFVDRTFNAKRQHAHSIMEYVIKNDNGITNFHFEVAPELIDVDFIELLARARNGLFQLEVGVQSTNEETLSIIQRKNDLYKIEEVVEKVHQLRNTHMHLDLIAGLPKEGYRQFEKSFNYVYSLKPDQLQLGFLKVLKGSGMMSLAAEYGILYRDYPPYEVLKTKDMTYEEISRLKLVEEMVELFYNSGQFQMTIDAIICQFETPFKAYEALASQWKDRGLDEHKHAKLDLFQFLYDFSGLKDLLMIDYCLNEKPKKKLDWMDYRFIPGEEQRFILDQLSECGVWKEAFEKFSTKQLSRSFHMDRLTREQLNRVNPAYDLSVSTSEMNSDAYLIVNYNRRDFMHNNGEAAILRVEGNEDRL